MLESFQLREGLFRPLRGWCLEKTANQSNGFGRSFFHQPMSRPFHNGFLNIGRNVAHDYGLQRTERLLATHSQHGDRQLSLFEDLVVLRVLRESGELRKARSHSSWLCVGRREKVSRGLIWLAGIAGEVIPNAVKINTF